MLKFVRKIAKNNKGATAIEYGLIAALISVAAIGAMNTLSGSITGTFTNAGNAMNN